MYCSARTAFATIECRPSAPMTTRARSVTVAPPLPWPRTPVTRPSSMTSSSTVNPSRTSAPASDAASTRSLSSTVRRGRTRRGNSAVAGGAGDRERSEVERIRVDRRTSRRQNTVEQAPALQRRHARRVDEVRRDRVAREGRLVDDEHLVAPPGQEHRRRRPGAARAHDDRVVVVRGHFTLLLSSVRAQLGRPRPTAVSVRGPGAFAALARTIRMVRTTGGTAIAHPYQPAVHEAWSVRTTRRVR